MLKTACIFNIQHFSVNDGPGIRTVVFFKGCSLNCAWCHNPESKSSKRELSFLSEKCVLCKKCAAVCSCGVHKFENDLHCIYREKCVMCGKCVEICKTSALEIIGNEYTYEEIMTDIAKDDMFFGNDGGVTFSGGEPFMQFEALYELLKMCKRKEYTVCIETSGYTSEEKIVRAAEYTDCFLFDCKETDEKKHLKYVGVKNDLILSNLEALNKIGAAVILRCPIIPGVNDRQEHFENIARLSDKYACVKSVEFMPYHPLGLQKSIQIGKTTAFYGKDFMDRKIIEAYCESVKDKMAVPVKIN